MAAKRGGVFFKSFVKEVIKDIEKKDIQLRTKAANYVKKKVKSKIGKRRKSRAGEPPAKFKGNLIKGIQVKQGGKYITYVGAVKPAYHATLLELGTRKMAKRPFLIPTLMEERTNIIKILSEVRV